jgi:hypothetical protein
VNPITGYAFPVQPDGTIAVLGGTAPYTIIPDVQGPRCSCPAATYRGSCKHLARAAELGLIVRAIAAPRGGEIPPPSDPFPQAIAQETVAILTRCEATLQRLGRRAVPLMRRYRDALARVGAEKARG